jgi:hypothetical protein
MQAPHSPLIHLWAGIIVDKAEQERQHSQALLQQHIAAASYRHSTTHKQAHSHTLSRRAHACNYSGLQCHVCRLLSTTCMQACTAHDLRWHCGVPSSPPGQMRQSQQCTDLNGQGPEQGGCVHKLPQQRWQTWKLAEHWCLSHQALGGPKPTATCAKVVDDTGKRVR